MMWVLLAAAFAGLVACAFVAGLSMGKRIGLSTAPYCEPAPESALLSAAEERVRVRDVRIAVLESVTVVGVSEFTVLPWQVIPAPAEAALLQKLTDEVQDLQAENVALRELVAYKDMLRARYLRSLRYARAKIRAMVPVAELAHVEELRGRSLSVARSAASRAADRAAVITELEIALVESMDLDEFNAQFGQILSDHGMEPVTT